jgi:hypothetical protein
MSGRDDESSGLMQRAARLSLITCVPAGHPVTQLLLRSRLAGNGGAKMCKAMGRLQTRSEAWHPACVTDVAFGETGSNRSR